MDYLKLLGDDWKRRLYRCRRLCSVVGDTSIVYLHSSLQRRAQVSKDSSMSGAKTATINKLDEEIKKASEAIKEDKYGLTNKSGVIGSISAINCRGK